MQDEAAPRAQVREPVDCRGIPTEMHCHNGAGSRGDERLDVGRVDHRPLEADNVREHRRAAGVQDCGGSGSHRVRRNDHLVPRTDLGGQIREV